MKPSLESRGWTNISYCSECLCGPLYSLSPPADFPSRHPTTGLLSVSLGCWHLLYFHSCDIIRYVLFFICFWSGFLQSRELFWNSSVLLHESIVHSSLLWELLDRMDVTMVFYIHSSFSEHLACFQASAITNKSSCGHMHSYLLDKYLMMLRGWNRE